MRTIALTLCFALAAPSGAFAEALGGAPKPAPAQASEQPQSDSAAQLLAEDEIAKLAARAEEPGKEVSGGALSNEHLTYIVIALAAAVIVLIAK